MTRHQSVLTIAAATAVVTLSGMALAASSGTMHLAQATQPTQSTPPSGQTTGSGAPPAEAKPGGTRPTTPAPEPARPDAQAQQEGAPAALPPAPAEKTAPPINAR